MTDKELKIIFLSIQYTLFATVDIHISRLVAIVFVVKEILSVECQRVIHFVLFLRESRKYFEYSRVIHSRNVFYFHGRDSRDMKILFLSFNFLDSFVQLK